MPFAYEFPPPAHQDIHHPPHNNITSPSYYMSTTTTKSFTTFHSANQFWRLKRACLIVGVSDGRKTTLIRDSINCCHRHSASSLGFVSPTSYIRRPASHRLLKCQLQECLPSRMSYAPECDDDMQTRCDMSHAIYDMGGCLQLNSHYRA